MNLHAPLPDHSVDEDFAPRSTGSRVSSLAEYAPRGAREKSPYSRYAGVIGVVLVHGLLALGYILAGPVFTKTAEKNVSVIDIPLDLPEDVAPPPPPKFTPPEVYVPAPIVPLLTLEEPPPQPNAITLPPAPVVNAPPTAPIAQAPQPVPFDGDARKAYVISLLKHLNNFKRYPEVAKLRHEQGVVFVRFTIDRFGHVLASSIYKSSGSKAIDAEMLAAVTRADPLPAIPAIFGRDKLDLVVGPVDFVLR